jgi:hypothetical protein
MKFRGMKPTCKIALEIRRKIVLKTNLSRHETSSFKKLRILLVPKQEIHHHRWALLRSRSGVHLIGISFYSFYQQGLCTYRCLRPETESKHIINHSSVPCNQLQTILLYRRWVQHNPNRCAEGLGRKIVLKLCSYYTGVTWKEVRTLPFK